MELKPFYLQLTPMMGELVWKQAPSDDLLAMQLAYIQLLEDHFADKLIEFRQGFTRISLRWKEETGHLDFQKILSDRNPVPVILPEKTWEIPVCYHESLAFDLEAFCTTKGLTRDQLTAIHTGSTYRIHFFGFLPGFFYLNGLPEMLHSPRKATPTLTVPAGSVAIGGAQTGIYPSQSPGGWHCIGQTPIPLFDPKSNPPVWAKSGEQIKFRSITFEEFNNWSDANSFFKQP